MTLLTKDQILSADDRDFKDLEVPEWTPKGSDVMCVRIMAMSGAERDSFEASLLDKKFKNDPKRALNFRARFIASCIVDEDGKRLFAASDIVALGKKSAAPISRVFDECRDLNGMTEEAAEEIAGE